MGRALGCSLALIPLLVLLFCAGLVFPLEFVFWMLVGWIWFLGRVIPSVSIDPGSVGLSVAALAAFVVGFHQLMWRLYQPAEVTTESGDRGAGDNTESQTATIPAVTSPQANRVWRPRLSVAITATLLLAFVAGICMVGITHQLVWMMTDDEPVILTSGDVRRAARRSQSSNNLKQLGLAFHNYADENQVLPAGATTGAHGQLYHGWITPLLPFMEQKPLYDTIDLTQPWTAKSNRQPFRTQLSSLLAARIAKTTDAAGYALTGYAANVHVLAGTSPRTWKEFPDGHANTIMAGEIQEQPPAWGSTTNWRDPGLGLNRPNGFGNKDDDGNVQFLFMDGSVKHFSADTDPAVLRALATPAGGEEIPVQP